MWNSRLDESQAGIKIPRRNNNNLRYADDTTLMTESVEVKSLLIRVKEESEKAGLKLNIQKIKIMVSGPIPSWQIEGGSGSSDWFSFLGLPHHCEWWLQPWNQKTLAAWKKNYDKPRQCFKKQINHFASKSPYSQSIKSKVIVIVISHSHHNKCKY